MNFADAKAIQARLEAEEKAASDALREYKDQRNSVGLTSDAVKFSPEYRAKKAAYDAAFTRLRKFNGWFLKSFKAEIRAERRAA